MPEKVPMLTHGDSAPAATSPATFMPRSVPPPAAASPSATRRSLARSGTAPVLPLASLGGSPPRVVGLPKGVDVPSLALKPHEGGESREVTPHDAMDDEVTARFHLERKLGQGGYAVVWRASRTADGSPVVIKKILDAFTDATDTQRVFRE
eukprot:91549-Prymnesium_polylepis.1